MARLEGRRRAVDMWVCSIIENCVLLFGTVFLDCWEALLIEGGDYHPYLDTAVGYVGW